MKLTEIFDFEITQSRKKMLDGCTGNTGRNILKRSIERF